MNVEERHKKWVCIALFLLAIFVCFTTGCENENLTSGDIEGYHYEETSDVTNYVKIVTNKNKVTITINNSQDMAIIAEIEAFGQEYDESLSPTNLALRKKITASNTDYERNPERIVDGNKGNYWDGGRCV